MTFAEVVIAFRPGEVIRTLSVSGSDPACWSACLPAASSVTVSCRRPATLENLPDPTLPLADSSVAVTVEFGARTARPATTAPPCRLRRGLQGERPTPPPAGRGARRA